MKLWKYLKKYLDQIEEKFLIFLSFISLTLTYVLGIGLTSLVAKLVKKKFFPNSKINSKWSHSNCNNKISEKMY